MSKIINMLERSESPLSIERIRNHFGKILLLLVLLLVYIEQRYEYEQAVCELASLKEKLEDERYTNIEEWGRLTAKNRPEAIRLSVAESSVELENSVEPPYLVK